MLKVEPDLALARRHLAKAKAELGLKNGRCRCCREIVRVPFRRQSTTSIRSEGLAWNCVSTSRCSQRLEKMRRGDFDIVVAAWGLILTTS